MSDEALYLKATQEVEGGNQDAALWAKAMAVASGDSKKAKYQYINLRVERAKSAPDMPSQSLGMKEAKDTPPLRCREVKKASASKKIMLSTLLAALLLFATLFIAASIRMQNPECATCGMPFFFIYGLPAWSLSVVALWYAVWTDGATKKYRFNSWLFASAVGWCVYFLASMALLPVFARGSSLDAAQLVLWIGRFSFLAALVAVLTLSHARLRAVGSRDY